MAGGGAATQSSGPKKARIEIIPLIDVVFFLLATFVLFTLSLNRIQSLQVQFPVPNINPQPPDEKDDMVTLQVTDGNSVYWNKEAISISEVYPRLAQYKGTSKDPRVLVSGDDRAKFGGLVEVLDMIKASGIEKVSVETVYRASGR